MSRACRFICVVSDEMMMAAINITTKVAISENECSGTVNRKLNTKTESTAEARL